MNPKDKKQYEQIKRAVKSMPKGTIVTGQQIGETLEKSGIKVYNIDSVLKTLAKETPYLQLLNGGNYRRTER